VQLFYFSFIADVRTPAIKLFYFTFILVLLQLCGGLYSVFAADTLLYVVTLTEDCLILNICNVSPVT